MYLSFELNPMQQPHLFDCFDTQNVPTLFKIPMQIIAVYLLILWISQNDHKKIEKGYKKNSNKSIDNLTQLQ